MSIEVTGEHSAVEAVYGAIVIEDTFHLPITQIAVLPQKKRGEMFNARRPAIKPDPG